MKTQNFKSLIIIIVMICYSLLIAQDVWIKGYNPINNNESYFSNNIMQLQNGNFLVSASYQYQEDEEFYERSEVLLNIDIQGNLIWAETDTAQGLNETVNSFTIEDLNGYIYSYISSYYYEIGVLSKRNSNGEFICLYYFGEDVYYQSGCLLYDNCLLLAGKHYDSQGTKLVLDKYDVNSNMIWRKEFGVHQYSKIKSIIETENHDIVFLGEYSSGDTTCVYRLNSEGNIIWNTKMEDECDRWNHPKSLIELSNHKIMASGKYEYNDYSNNAYLALFEPSGNHLWTNIFDDLAQIYCVVEADSENVLFTSRRFFTKYNYVTDEIIFENELINEEFPHTIIGKGNKNIVKTNDGYIISGNSDCSNYLLLFKTDLNGSVPVEENTIIPSLNNINLKYKNPFYDNVSFKIVNNQKSQSKNNIQIYNIKGQKITTLQFYENNVKWNANSIASGIYFIHLNNDNKIYKILKVK